MSEGTLALGCFDNGRKWLELAKVGRKKEKEICQHLPIQAIFCHYQNSPRQVSLLTFTNNKTAQADVLSGVPATVDTSSGPFLWSHAPKTALKLPQKCPGLTRVNFGSIFITERTLTTAQFQVLWEQLGIKKRASKEMVERK